MAILPFTVASFCFGKAQASHAAAAVVHVAHVVCSCDVIMLHTPILVHMQGVSTAAYQHEGGWNTDGRGPSVWDTFTHTPGKIQGGETGDVSVDQYHR